MKTRSAIISIVIVLALIILFSLPALAQTDNNVTINNLTYDGIQSNRTRLF